MKTLEQIEKEEKMFDTLGIYYDSRESRLPNIPKELNLKAVSRLEFVNNGLRTVTQIVGPDNVHHEISNSNIEDLVNHYAPNMAYIQGPDTDRWNRNSFHLRYEHQSPYGNFSANGVSADNVWRIATEGRNTDIPRQIEFDIRVLNSNSLDQIKQAFSKARKGLTPEGYFKSVCSADVEAPGGSTMWLRGKRVPKFAGAIKNNIMRKDRRTMIFFIQYLYGHKTSRNATINDIYQLLKNIPYSDFGLRDVKDLEKVAQIVENRHGIITIKEEFEKLGLKPAKELVRWKELRPPKPKVEVENIQDSNVAQTSQHMILMPAGGHGIGQEFLTSVLEPQTVTETKE